MALLRKDVRLAAWAVAALAVAGFAYVGVLAFSGGEGEPETTDIAAAEPMDNADPLAAWSPRVTEPTAEVVSPVSEQDVLGEEAWPDELQIPAAEPTWRNADYATGRDTRPIGDVAADIAAGNAPSADASPDRVFDVAAQTHTVASGDNFVTIAKRYYDNGDLFDIITRANPKLDPRRLSIGDTVIVPALDAAGDPVGLPKVNADARTHTVRGGQTLSDIAAERLGRSALWQEIYDLNREAIGDDPGTLQVGMELKLPQ